MWFGASNPTLPSPSLFPDRLHTAALGPTRNEMETHSQGTTWLCPRTPLPTSPSSQPFCPQKPKLGPRPRAPCGTRAPCAFPHGPFPTGRLAPSEGNTLPFTPGGPEGSLAEPGSAGSLGVRHVSGKPEKPRFDPPYQRGEGGRGRVLGVSTHVTVTILIDWLLMGQGQGGSGRYIHA